MVNYANAKIYKICPINGEDECYIGSTTQRLSVRMAKHRHDTIHNMYGKTFSSNLFDKYGIENCKIVLITKFPCICKEELDAEEAYHIKNNNCVNKLIPGRTKKQYYQDNKEQIIKNKKQYRQDNKEQMAEKAKQYYQDNKEQIIEKNKQYYQDNKEQIIKNKKQYYQDLKTKYHCICGNILTIGAKAKHKRTTTHIKGEQAFHDGCYQALLELELNNNK